MYLPTSFIGQRTQQFRAAPCLTWDQVRELSKKGIRFGSHTVSHPKLIDLDWDEIQRELTESKFTLEQQLGRSVVDFAYPFAYPDVDTQFVSRFTEALQKSGYENCATTIIGKAMSGDSPLALKRLPVNDCDDISLFAAKLEGAYNWLAIPQRLKKIRAHKAAASGTLSP